MQRLTGLLVLVVCACLVAGCESSMNLTGTKLTLTALNPNFGLAVFHIDCGPSGGDVSDPVKACAALGHDPKLVTAPQPFTCLGGPTSWFDVTISGLLAGKPVHRKFSTCWTPQMATLGKLGLAQSLRRHVRPRRRGVVIRGVRRTFPRGTLRPGDLLVCDILHHRLNLSIPRNRDRIGKTSVGFGGRLVEVGNSSNETTKDVVNITLSGTRTTNGSMTARCRRRKT